MSKDIVPENEEGNLHGYCEAYWENGKLMWKGVQINGWAYGYHEAYNLDGGVDEYGTGYWMNGYKASDDNEIGYCLIWCKDIV